MKKSFVRILIFFSCTIAALLFSQCEYSPTGVNFLEKDSTPLPATITVNLDFSKDTLNFFNVESISYSIDTDAEIYSVLLEIGGRGFSSREKEDIFSFDSKKLTDGVYNMKMRYSTKSGTGSIADQASSEIIKYEKNWIVNIDNFMDSLKIIEAKPENGRLKLTWEKSKSLNFKYYKLIKGFESIKTIYDIDSNFYFDSTFIGGTIQQGLQIVSSNGVFETTGPRFFVSDLPPENLISISNIGFSKAKLSWPKTKYYNSFYKYKITRNGKTIAELFNPTDTSFVDSLFTHLEEQYYLVKTENINNSGWYVGAIGYNDSNYEEKYKAFYMYLSNTDSYYSYTNSGLVQYDRVTNDIISKSSTSSDGIMAFYYNSIENTIYGGTVNSIFSLNPVTLQKINEFSPSNIISEEALLTSGFIYENNILIYIEGHRGSNGITIYTQGVIVIDVNRKTVITKYENTYRNFISVNNGTSFIQGLTLFKINTTSLEEKKTYSSIPIKIKNKIAEIDGKTINLYDQDGISLIESHEFNFFIKKLLVDPVTDLWGVVPDMNLNSLDNNFYIYDRVRKKIITQMNTSELHLFFDKKIVTDEGMYLDISEAL